MGANYGWSAITDVREAPQPVVTTRTETMRAIDVQHEALRELIVRTAR